MFQINPSLFQLDIWSTVMIIVGAVVFLAITIVWGIRAHRHQASAGREELVGKIAEVRTVMEPKGMVFIQGERWVAISQSGRVEPGEEVIITKVDGLKLWVTKK